MTQSELMKRLLLISTLACLTLTAVQAQGQKRALAICLEIRETNLNQPSTVAINTLTDKLKEAGLRIVAKRKDANVVVDGTIASRTVAVTDEAQRQGGVNAEATASLRLLAGGEVIATSVARSNPGDWGVQAERVGEDRLIEAATRAAEDLLDSNFVDEVSGSGKTASAEDKTNAPTKAAPARRDTARRPNRPAGPKRGVSYLEVVSLLQNYVPEERITGAVKKYGIKFKPNEAALAQLRSAGASESVIAAIKSSAG
jgi:hypothetical protein